MEAFRDLAEIKRNPPASADHLAKDAEASAFAVPNTSNSERNVDIVSCPVCPTTNPVPLAINVSVVGASVNAPAAVVMLCAAAAWRTPAVVNRQTSEPLIPTSKFCAAPPDVIIGALVALGYN